MIFELDFPMVIRIFYRADLKFVCTSRSNEHHEQHELYQSIVSRFSTIGDEFVHLSKQKREKPFNLFAADIFASQPRIGTDRKVSFVIESFERNQCHDYKGNSLIRPDPLRREVILGWFCS